MIIRHHSARAGFQPRGQGFTLVETLIIVVIASLLMMALFSLFEWHSSMYKYQQALVRVTGSARASLQAMDLYVRQAGAVLSSHDFNGTVYNSGPSVLVLQLPSVDDNGDVLAGKSDYIVFYADGNRLMQRVQADASSARVSITKQLSDTLDSLTLTYDNVDPAQVKMVSADIRTVQQVKGQVVRDRLSQNMYLKNH